MPAKDYVRGNTSKLINNEYYEIYLNSTKYPGRKALVNREDYDIIKDYTWYPNIKGERKRLYALAYNKITQKTIYMHVVLNPNWEMTDHIWHDEDLMIVDNRKDNLRECTGSQNAMNQRIQKNKTSQYRGVSWYKKTNKWQTNIKLNNKTIHIGYYYYKDEEEAARAYDTKAKKLFGSFAKTNF